MLRLKLTSVLSALALAGHLAVYAPAQAFDLSAPAWLNLEQEDAIASVEWMGEAGAETSRGTVIMTFRSDGQSEMEALRNHFVLEGYVVSPVSREFDRLMGVSDVARATDPITGRSVTLTRLDEPNGSLLMLSFIDPRAAL